MCYTCIDHFDLSCVSVPERIQVLKNLISPIATLMTEKEFLKIFRDNPDDITRALHAIKTVADEFSGESMTTKEKAKWDSILHHAIKLHGVTFLLFKNDQEHT